MRFLPLALAGVLLVAPSAPAADDADVAVTKWLVLPAVDPTPRRTLRADAVFAKYLLDRASPPPKAGDEVTGTLGKPAKWAARAADEKGEVDGEGVAWCYASVESPADRVVLAKLDGAGVLYVNGAGFTGDVYDIDDIGVPVALRKGANDVYVAVPRGGIRLTLTKPADDPTTGTLNPIDDPDRAVVPDYVEGERVEELLSAHRILNVTAKPLVVPSRSLSLVPLAVGTWVGDPVLGRPTTRTAQKVEAHAPRRRTFVSSIDGSVQSYALVPPAPSDIDKSKIGVVLSLHGASVDCMDQARAYAPKPDFWIVCPTNRGRFGFDWQDWGRLDAYEVLADALKVTGVDPRRVYLTGHSMGGHGTWNLAANDPGRFLAIAPCSGWSSFESYGAPRAVSPLGRLWRAADGASRTLELVDNLAQVPAFVLHGEADDIVPASEARLMIDAIEKAGGHPQSHFEPGAAHWWDKDEKTPGADCVDWPAIWELFRRTQPSAEPPGTVSFTTMDLDVNHSKDWITIDQPIEYGKPSRVTATCDAARRFTISTENVRKFDVLASQAPGKGIATYVVDGKTWPVRERGYGEFERGDDGTWGAIDDVGALMKRIKLPHRSGPFKRAFTNRFVLVYGTGGDDVEDRELLEMARYDSEVWAYRANGDANLMSDAQFLAGDFKDRNVIVYGNADTNRAWSAVFDDDCPIQAKRGVMTVNGTKHEGVVAAVFVRPRKGSDVALAAAFADTGPKATRLFYEFLVFSSGIGIPDYVVFGPGFLSERDGDVRAAGWFDYAWRMK
jgi:dienelactone hydrolase